MQATTRFSHAVARQMGRRYASAQPAVAATTSKPSLFESFFYDAPDQNALDEAFPGVPEVTGKSTRVGITNQDVKVSKLSNGLRVASVDSEAPYASVGLTVRAGSRHETAPGTAFVLKHLAFKSTQRRSGLKLYRDVDERGGAVGAEAGRETFSYTTGVLRDEIGAVTEALAETVLQPKIAPWEITEQMDDLAFSIQAFNADPRNVLAENIHAAAFGHGSSMGRSLVPTIKQAGAVDVDTVREFLGNHFNAGNIVMTASNMEHDRVVDLADMYFLSVPEGQAGKNAAPKVLGGESVIRTDSDTAHVAIALEAPSLTSGKDLHVLGILQTLLGSGPSGFLGSNSRVASLMQTEQHSDIGSMAAFAFPYSDTGLVGLMATGADEHAGKMIETMANLFKELASKQVSAEELQRAKAKYQMNYASNIDSRLGYNSDMSAQLSITGKYQTYSEVAKDINSVTAADVQRVAQQAAKSNPSVAALSSTLSSVPRYDVFANYFK